MWAGQRLTPHQWAFCNYHLRRDKAEAEVEAHSNDVTRAFLMNWALLKPENLTAHATGEDKRVDLPEEDPVFQSEMVLSDAAQRHFGVGKYANMTNEAPALSPKMLQVAEKFDA